MNAPAECTGGPPVIRRGGGGGGGLQLRTRSEGRRNALMSSLQITRREACSNTKLFLACRGDRNGGTCRTRGQCFSLCGSRKLSQVKGGGGGGQLQTRGGGGSDKVLPLRSPYPRKKLSEFAVQGFAKIPVKIYYF